MPNVPNYDYLSSNVMKKLQKQLFLFSSIVMIKSGQLIAFITRTLFFILGYLYP